MKISKVDDHIFNDIWNKSIERNPFQSIVITDLCKPSKSEVFNLVFFDNETKPLVLYTIYVNKLKSLDKYFSCNSSYGYSSPTFFSRNLGKKVITNFNKSCDKFLIKKNVITEYERCSLDFNSFCRTYDEICHSRANVYVDLTKAEKQLFQDFNRSVRKSLNISIKQNLRIELFDENNFNKNSIDIFSSIYFDTMERNKADKYYFFNEKKLKLAIKKSLIEKFGLIHIVFNSENNPIAAEWTLLSNFSGYSFLGGLNIKYSKLRASDFLKYHIIFDLKYLGLKNYFIGGGKEDFDGIYLFKKKFSSSLSVSALSTRKIHLQDKFNKALENANIGNKLNDKNFFPPFK